MTKMNIGPPPRLLPSLDLIQRTIAAEDAYTLSRIKVLERVPGNPWGVEYRLLDDGVVALMARQVRSPSFNSVRGLRARHERHIESLVRWYRDNDVAGRFEMAPGLFDAGLGRELGRLGYCHSEFHCSLIGEPDVVPASDAAAVERVTDAAAMEDYLDAYAAQWKHGDKERFKANARTWLHEPDWSLYLARVDGRPAAAATLFVHRKVGYFADAATDPAFRGRGLHRALLARRWQDARAAGVDFVCSGAGFLTSSHRNMERSGMRIQFNRAIWTECAPTS